MPACEGTYLATTNLRHSVPDCLVFSLPHSQETKDQTLHSAQLPAHQPCLVRSHNAFVMPISVLPLQLGSVGYFHLFPLLAEWLHANMHEHGVPAKSHLNSTFKRISLWSHTAAPSPGLVLCVPHLPQKHKVSLSHSCPQPASQCLQQF